MLLNYSNGLNLLLQLIWKEKKKKLMRVSPLNHYQLVDIKPDPELQLASTKNHLVHGCTSFICFGRAATGLETSPSHLKLQPQSQPQPQPPPQDDLKHSPDSEKLTKTCTPDLDLDNIENKNGDSLKSSLKKQTTSVIASIDVNGGECKNECCDRDTETRKVQWTDVFGGELFEIREFEPSEHDGSDDESNWNEGTCTCMIM